MRRYPLLLFLSLCPLSAVYAQSIPADLLLDTMALQQLGAVTISARRPMLQHKEGKFIVNVDRTVLADAGSDTTFEFPATSGAVQVVPDVFLWSLYAAC